MLSGYNVVLLWGQRFLRRPHSHMLSVFVTAAKILKSRGLMNVHQSACMCLHVSACVCVRACMRICDCDVGVLGYGLILPYLCMRPCLCMCVYLCVCVFVCVLWWNHKLKNVGRKIKQLKHCKGSVELAADSVRCNGQDGYPTMEHSGEEINVICIIYHEQDLIFHLTGKLNTLGHSYWSRVTGLSPWYNPLKRLHCSIYYLILIAGLEIKLAR
jgi:hypothetical protein